MASNKESLVVVLDVRRCTSEEFKLKSVKCVAEIMKDKIVGDKKDYISIVLLGCENSPNKNYPNIVQYEHPKLCSWELLLEFFKFVNETPCESGEWLDGLRAAMGLQEQAFALKCARYRVLLLFDFNHMEQQYDDYENITSSLYNAGIDIIVGSPNVVYTTNLENNESIADFQTSAKVTDSELMNQKQARKLVNNCNATLCNLKEVLSTVFKVSNRRPWSWNAKLRIGTEISISLQGIIAMKKESHINLKKVWAKEEETVEREQRFFIKGTEVTPLPEDLIDGYMLGGTPVPYDETIVELPPAQPPGLHFLGFVKEYKIPGAYFCGDSLYRLVHQKGNPSSARKLDALVRALVHQKSVILCWKVYSAKFNTPRIVVLFPKESKDLEPASLYMQEISYHAQHMFWDFPSLRTAKTECTEDQLQAVDKLIDSMNLECTLGNTQQPRQHKENDLLPFEDLPSIFEQNVKDVLERKVIFCRKSDQQFNDMLKDKNIVDVFWRVPEQIEEKSKKASSELKKLFPLEKSQAWLEKLKAMEAEENSPPAIEQEEVNHDASMDTIDSVGLINPVQDYKQILGTVRSITNTTQKDAQFQSLSAQMRVVVVTLLERSKLNLEQLSELLTIYRNSCLEFSSFSEYNQFAAELKQKVLSKKLLEFWENVMVKNQLGLLVLGEPTLDDEVRLNTYYTMPKHEKLEDEEMAKDV